MKFGDAKRTCRGVLGSDTAGTLVVGFWVWNGLCTMQRQGWDRLTEELGSTFCDVEDVFDLGWWLMKHLRASWLCFVPSCRNKEHLDVPFVRVVDIEGQLLHVVVAGRERNWSRFCLRGLVAVGPHVRKYSLQWFTGFGQCCAWQKGWLHQWFSNGRCTM